MTHLAVIKSMCVNESFSHLVLNAAVCGFFFPPSISFSDHNQSNNLKRGDGLVFREICTYTCINVCVHIC